MNQEFNEQSQTTNRFIFSDDFYNSLDPENANIKQETTIDTKVIPPMENIAMNQEVKKEIETPINSNIQDNNIEQSNFEKQQSEEFKFPNIEYQQIQKPIEEEKIEIPVSEIDPVEQINNQTLKVETKTELQPEPVVEENKELMTPEIPKSETNVQNNYQVPSNKFNVETGINTDLEKEIMKAKVETQAIPTIVENNNYLVTPEEKVPYRAKRNNLQVNTNFYEQKEEKIEPVINVSLKPIVENTVNNNVTYMTPPIINIDEELIKEKDNKETNIQIEEPTIDNSPVVKSNLLTELLQKEQQTNKISILAHYGDDFCSKDYITNPAIGREEEIKQLILILLTPEKSGILVGKPGIGKTSIVEGLAYRLQRNKVPEALKGYRIVSVKTTSLIGTLPTGEAKLQALIDELKELDKIILFIDEIHMLMGATNESSLDFANMFKESLGRGSIKMIGATTNDEYERYVLRDKAFVRRFQRVDVEEPSKEHTIKILMGTLPKIEKNTGAKLKYSNFIQTEIMSFIVDITTEYKRVYGIGSRYPDICLTLLSQAFSQAVFDNRNEVNILDIRHAIENSKNIYPDVIRKELVNFDNKFKQIIEEEK